MFVIGKVICIVLLLFLAGVAAVIDARRRVFPNSLAVGFVCACVIYTYVFAGFNRLTENAICAIVLAVILTFIEVIWRSSHDGASGMGFGDVKFMGAIMLLHPLGALLSFAAGLVLLALVGVFTKRSSLPLLPFIVVSTLFLLFPLLCVQQ